MLIINVICYTEHPAHIFVGYKQNIELVNGFRKKHQIEIFPKLWCGKRQCLLPYFFLEYNRALRNKILESAFSTN